MTGILDGMRVVEGSAFVAAPLGGMTLAQLGADVIRFDPIGGGLDRERWPVTADGQSLFWAGLNKGKRSIQVDLSSEEGRELVAGARSPRPGPTRACFLTNFPARGFLDYERARRAPARPDHGQHRRQPRRLVRGRLHGQPGHGLRLGHGPAEPGRAVQPPAAGVGRDHRGCSAPRACWPPSAGGRRTGEGQLVRVALSDVAFWMVGNLGKIAEVQINHHERVKDGNYLYGAFGRDFLTKDGRRVMIVALTLRQWRNLVEATGLGEAFDADRPAHGRRPRRGGRPLRGPRGASAPRCKPWVLARTLDGGRARLFDRHGVSWGPYQTFTELVERRSALLAGEPDVRRGRAAGDRHAT